MVCSCCQFILTCGVFNGKILFFLIYFMLQIFIMSLCVLYL